MFNSNIKFNYVFIESGKYYNKANSIEILDIGPLFKKSGRWMITVKDKNNHVFVWPFFSDERIMASTQIIGFKTLKDAKNFDVTRYLYKSIPRYNNKRTIYAVNLPSSNRIVSLIPNFDVTTLLEASIKEDERINHFLENGPPGLKELLFLRLLKAH